MTLGWGGVFSLSFTVLANMLSALIHAPTVLAMALGATLLGLVPGWGALWTLGALMMGFAYGSAMVCAVTGARRAGFRPQLSSCAQHARLLADAGACRAQGLARAAPPPLSVGQDPTRRFPRPQRNA
jgi:hypothetical protein